MPRKLLIIESDVQLSVALELFFRGRSYDVRVAATQAEAMTLAASGQSDVVLIGNLADLVDAGTLAQKLRPMIGERAHIITLSHAIDVAGADLVIPMGAHPRAILDGIRTLGRKRTGPRPAVQDDVG
jgi:DNA-binding response OmpR family regulator